MTGGGFPHPSGGGLPVNDRAGSLVQFQSLRANWTWLVLPFLFIVWFYVWTASNGLGPSKGAEDKQFFAMAFDRFALGSLRYDLLAKEFDIL